MFVATITMVDGAPVVEWSPKLSAAEESRRRYTIYGRAGLESGEEWRSPTNALDRFFMVGVEMKWRTKVRRTDMSADRYKRRVDASAVLI